MNKIASSMKDLSCGSGGTGGDETVLQRNEIIFETIFDLDAALRKRRLANNPHRSGGRAVKSGDSRMRPLSFMLALGFLLAGACLPARAEIKLPDARGDFVRLCAPHMLGRWAHPESVCGCLHDYAVAVVEDNDLRLALLRGISETGVPTIEDAWVPPAKRSQIGATFTKVARPTLQCMFEPLN
jgi:hypothetical protein